jgi:hypothetical protein
MTMTRRITKLSFFGVAAAAFTVFAAEPASARSAVFYSSQTFGPTMPHDLSQANGSGPIVSIGNWLALVFSQPFGVSRSDTVSIFTFPPRVGDARLQISFGRYNGGAPIIIDSRQVNAGNVLTIGNLFQQGCSGLGGCDYIRVETIRQRRGADGAGIDYVNVNGEVTEVTEPKPEPATWALMILGFAGVALRLKALRRRNAPGRLVRDPAFTFV